MVLIFLEETGSAFRWASEVQKLQRFVWLSGGLPKYRNSKDSFGYSDNFRRTKKTKIRSVTHLGQSIFGNYKEM
ncbi:hypothetical protein RhiirB3_437492 [Rhizophagus irregularis]|nr:hypothetical protein RhiirB3_437492 [Rhizophagus irregularis]